MISTSEAFEMERRKLLGALGVKNYVHSGRKEDSHEDVPGWQNQATDESGYVVAGVPQAAATDRLIKTPEFVTKDSGVRHKEVTGAVRDSNAGKGRFDLIPPVPLKRLAQLYQRGAEKYGDNNWRLGINLARYLDSALRHINDYQTGDRSEDHLIAAAWNLFGYVATEQWIKEGKLPAELDNVSKEVK